MLYSAAKRYETADLEEFCFRFLTNHLTEIALSGALNDLDEVCVKNFLVKAAAAGAFRY
jgi:RCC1 and BTB domain-containing protein